MMARRSGDTWKSDSLPVPAGSDDSAELCQALAARALSGMFGAPAAPERKSSESEAPPSELPPVSWTSKLKSREWEAFRVCGSGVEA